MNILESYFKKTVFRNFLKIELNANEISVAQDSLKNKYTKGAFESILYGLLCIPTLLFVDTSILTSVLIPITMVSGTAWFAVSLINIKKKFESFGNELTIDLYRSFITSLVLLSLMTIIALNSSLFVFVTSWGNQYPIVGIMSGLVGTMVVLKMIYDIFSGATKYDMNDSMLTGQNEAAEKFFKKSLSLLSSCAHHIKQPAPPDTTGYFVGLAFYEIFSFILSVRGHNDRDLELIKLSEGLKSKPPSQKKEIANICIKFVEAFLQSVSNLQDSKTKKSYVNIRQELKSVRDNTSETQQVLNLRIATIIEEIEDMLAGQGEALFIKRVEIEKKFLVKKLPDNLNQYTNFEIIQGYLSLSKSFEERIRKQSGIYTKTTKEPDNSGYRIEREEYITENMFNESWPKTDGKRIKKIRYQIPYQDFVIELDKFSDENSELILAEVEFKSEQEIKNFKIPVWFGEEVTTNPKYKNANLAK
jgi:CYTH domain-containing protein